MAFEKLSALRFFSRWLPDRDGDWINSRPPDETWNVISSGILYQDLGPAEFHYHPRTVRKVFDLTGLTIHTPKSFIPLLLMAPFEIISNSNSGDFAEGVLERQHDEVKNLTVMMAIMLPKARLRSRVPSIEDSLDPSEEEGSHRDEVVFCRLVLSLLREVSGGELGNMSDLEGPSLAWETGTKTLCQGFATPDGPHISYAEINLTSDEYSSYRELFQIWGCKFKRELVSCVHCLGGRDKVKVVKMNPDLSCAMFRFEGVKPYYAYMHSGRGMAINSIYDVWYMSMAEKVQKLKYSRDSWEVRSTYRTSAAWILVAISVAVSVLRIQRTWTDGYLEAFIAGVEVLSIMLIAVFGFVKLWIHDDVVLFRLMTGWRAVNSREEMLKYFCGGLKDLDECEAELTRYTNDTGNKQFSEENACAQRFRSMTGELRLEGLKDEYLGRASYIGLGSLVVDFALNKIVLIKQYGTGDGHFEEKAPLTTENVERLLETCSTINGSAERELVTRRIRRYV